MDQNIKPVSLREGHIFVDGVEVMDAVKCSVVFKPDVWSGKMVGKKGTNRRWLGYDITGTLEEYKTTPRWIEMVKKYIADGKTPELTIQATRSDADSDYFKTNGSETITVSGVVITGDINLLEIDVEGEVVRDAISFGAKDFV